ncbi:MAG: hypothetical protein ACRCZP_11465 [Phycicoccus sp.]
MTTNRTPEQQAARLLRSRAGLGDLRGAQNPDIRRAGGHHVTLADAVTLLPTLEGITDVPGLSRAAKLRIAGNGVVPQQATHALRYLITNHTQRKAAA